MKFNITKKEIIENAPLTISYLIRATYLVAIIVTALQQKWTMLFVSLAGLLLTFLPAILERNYKIYLPSELELTFGLFIFTALFFGEVRGFYTKFWWWDMFLHTLSGAALGFLGFLLLYSLYQDRKIFAKPVTIALFTFSFALAIGAVWEILEFSLDSFFGLNMQKSGLVDTMSDLIVDAIGAIIAATIGYFYVSGTRHHIFKQMVEKFVEKNPDMFPLHRRRKKWKDRVREKIKKNKEKLKRKIKESKNKKQINKNKRK
ncbi:hypothetical protein HN587_04370 [Candidatus Woesearchaeota archaeon]|jgi:hypothetical protein|nr:hypothetical protein [Candidatus Woesearchaeota archaeon]